ncbi:hypothetical protein M153_3200043298 [Pseudoloma neurophilia]|uniref:Uncharacterized protein n=1 Tax=Pseudoloma neurophilia TaxID=146866 RepID=A0A0R0M9Y1_9MICR|nr:hypothetical protein M153_3200043298 [Pseudoloma neurophilia]
MFELPSKNPREQMYLSKNKYKWRFMHEGINFLEENLIKIQNNQEREKCIKPKERLLCNLGNSNISEK